MSISSFNSCKASILFFLSSVLFIVLCIDILNLVREFLFINSIITYNSPLVEAKRYLNLFNDPLINSQSDIARDLGVTRARVSQVLSLLKLAPEIQKTLLGFTNKKMMNEVQ